MKPLVLMNCSKRTFRLPKKLKFSSTKEIYSKCSCGTVFDGLLCPSCHKLVKIDSQKNYFDLFGIDKCYDLSINDLNSSFKRLQSILHPDKFAIKSDEEKENATFNSSFVNVAFKVLGNPIERANYMVCDSFKICM